MCLHLIPSLPLLQSAAAAAAAASSSSSSSSSSTHDEGFSSRSFFPTSVGAFRHDASSPADVAPDIRGLGRSGRRRKCFRRRFPGVDGRFSFFQRSRQSRVSPKRRIPSFFHRRRLFTSSFFQLRQFFNLSAILPHRSTRFGPDGSQKLGRVGAGPRLLLMRRRRYLAVRSRTLRLLGRTSLELLRRRRRYWPIQRWKGFRR